MRDKKQHEKIIRGSNPKALVLLSGGLDSTLAAKMMMNQGIEIEAVHFKTPFCNCDYCALNDFSKKVGLLVHHVFLGQEFLRMLVNPPHGYGSQMNPCIDCRILMLQKAKNLAELIDAKFIVTGEVLDQRPFSQRRETMLHIEEEAGLKGKILRPLSARLLPESEAERDGVVHRELQLEIQGRRRIPQMTLAKELGLKDYPCPSGGCLLTDPRFADRLRDYLKHNTTLTIRDVELLKVGRHFRIAGIKIIVGRDEAENRKILTIAEKVGIPWFETLNYNGPIALILGKKKSEVIEKAAAIVARYSDAPIKTTAKVSYNDGIREIFQVKPIEDQILQKLRI